LFLALFLERDVGNGLASVNLDQYNQYMNWIDRPTALARLGVKPQTLYAYVSRGHISSRPHENDPRSSLYSLEDIETFLKRRRAGRARSAVAKAAISWGDPVMETAITTVRAGQLIYRGEDAVALSRHVTLEGVAALLWQTDETTIHAGAIPARITAASCKARLLSFLANEAAQAPHGLGRDASALKIDAARLLNGAAIAITCQSGAAPFHEKLAQFWQLDAQGADLVRRALVLIADHELNASTFAARVAASTGNSLAAAALAGCATLTGPLHGEASAQALVFLKNFSENPDPPARALHAVGHPLYPAGDPRAAALLEALSPSQTMKDAISAAEVASGELANIDMALAAMTVELGLPEDAPFLLFASGRLVGWLAHAMEQLTSGKLIRPRATYTGH
jgi:citrate synthase